MTSQHAISIEESPYLVVEEPLQSFYSQPSASMMIQPGKTNSDAFLNKSCPTCWEHIQRVYIVYPSARFQGYLARRLDVPHYHVLAKEYPQWLFDLKSYQSLCNTLFELVHCTADRDWGNDFVCVKNSLFNFTKSTQDVRNSKEFPTDLLETVLLE